jgi:glucose-6-phosphate isomerase
MGDVTLDVNNVLTAQVGDHGLEEKDLKSLEPQVKEAVKAVQKNRGKDMTGWFDLPYEKDQVKRILASARRKRGKYEDVVVLGIGGSALGTIAVRTALLHPYHNMLDRQQRKGAPRLHVLDNVDPVVMARFFEDVIDPHKTLFIVISKSGSTAETMSQFMVAYELIESCLGDRNMKKHLVAITDEQKGRLRPLADELDLESYAIPDGVGGRFSVLSPVGLLPAALVGVDVRSLLAGAARMDERAKTASLFKNPAAMYAAVHYLADTKKNASMSVMMPYCSGLRDLADWYCQLWAESLGKAKDRNGKTVNVGQTPIKALGATDQHSQVQLYREGPYDKVTTFVAVEEFETSLPIPAVFEEVEGMGYLGGRSFNQLIDAERVATTIALTDAERMNLTMTLPKLDAESLGQAFFLLEAATAYAGELYNIDAFDQPGVEAGKVATYALMGRKGYEKEAKEIAKRKGGQKKYIV